MKVTSVTVQIGRKISQNYNSLSNSVGLSADLEDGEDHEQVVRHLQAECHRLLLREKAAQGKTDEK